MKIKTALRIIVLAIGLGFLGSHAAYAVTYFEGVGGDVNINANIIQDLYSQLSVYPGTVEVKEPARVDLHMLYADGAPQVGRNIVIYINGNSTGVSISQPTPSDANGTTHGSISSTVPGTYEVCAKDTTDSIDIYILDCETLYIVPVAIPTLLSEPPYSSGLSNTLSWNMSGSGDYTYFIQSSTDSNFTNISQESDWTSSKSYEFANLVDGQIYFYRVKARNAFGVDSGWSNLAYSVQDNTNPTITLLSISGLDFNTTQDWEAQDILTFKLRVKDNIGVVSRGFWCVARDDSPKDCLSTESISGDIWTVRVKLGDLEHDSDYYLFPQYTFCAQALDEVGNVGRTCAIVLNVPVTTVPPVQPIPQVIEKIKDTVNEILDNSMQVAQNTIGRINQTSLQQISITVTIGNILVGMGILIGGLGTIPYVLLQVFLALSSLLGFRKKGHPAGYVYDSVTKEPLPQCIVRVFNGNNELVWTDVTDRDGYFKTTDLKAGEYTIKVTGRDYEFPSRIVFGKTDFPLENVYHGQEFYAPKGNVPNFAIPMDRREMGDVRYVFSQFAFISKVLWKFLHLALFLVGLIFSIYALSINNVWYNYVILFLYVPSIFALLSSFFGKGQRYGVVKDTNGKRLSGIVLGLKEKEFDKLISKRVTNDLGRFRFFVYPGIYDLEVLSSEWKVVEGKNLTDIKIKKEDILVRDITLERIVEEKKIKKVKVEEVLQPLEEL